MKILLTNVSTNDFSQQPFLKQQQYKKETIDAPAIAGNIYIIVIFQWKRLIYQQYSFHHTY